ncbi:unnamed protein product [Urochloa humidicola]
MEPAPTDFSNKSDADIKAPNAVVKCEPVDAEHAEDPVPPFGSFGDKVAEDDHGDSTECSSSFGHSGFGSDDDTESDAGIMEVESPLYSHTNVHDTPTVSHIVSVGERLSVLQRALPQRAHAMHGATQSTRTTPATHRMALGVRAFAAPFSDRSGSS